MNWAKKRVKAKGMNKIRVMAIGPVPVATSAVGQEETLAAEAEEILAAEVPVATSAAEGTPVEVEAAAISNSEGSQANLQVGWPCASNVVAPVAGARCASTHRVGAGAVRCGGGTLASPVPATRTLLRMATIALVMPLRCAAPGRGDARVARVGQSPALAPRPPSYSSCLYSAHRLAVATQASPRHTAPHPSL